MNRSQLVEKQDKRMQLSVEVAAGEGISLTAGFISRALRAASMAVSLLVDMPTRRQFYPMPGAADDDDLFERRIGAGRIEFSV